MINTALELTLGKHSGPTSPSLEDQGGLPREGMRRCTPAVWSEPKEPSEGVGVGGSRSGRGNSLHKGMEKRKLSAFKELPVAPTRI